MSNGTVKTIKLRVPVKGMGADGDITELNIRKPTGKELRKVPTEPKTLDEMCDFAIALCDHPPAVFDRMDGEDAMELLEVASGFFPESLKTGGSGSPR